ncbi:MAG: LemA family protein [Planctomycetota bacterium]|jgi:LemA protein
MGSLSGGIIALIVIGVIGVLFFLFVMGAYNKLVTLRERFKNGFAQIEVQLKRRYDLIPNLVETAKGYLKHEKETLENVIAARNQASAGLAAVAADPGNLEAMQGLIGAEGALGAAMSRLNVVMEAYPDLKANVNMQQVSEELTSTENKIAFSRQAYNDGCTAYNIYKKKFPQVMIANVFGFNDAPLLEYEDAEEIKEAPKVQF